MNRRQFLQRGAAGAGVLMAVPAVALADHVSEPSLAIKSMTLNVYKYPDLSTRINNFDGSEVRTWEHARIEPLLSFEGTKADNANPSEHFRVLVRVNQVVDVARNITKKDWDADWRHQNRPPHSNTAQRWEVSQSNTYDLQSHQGMWEVFVQVVGDVSLRVLEQTCRFTIVAP